MCRMVAYFGPPIRAADVVTRPSRSIIRQSYDARERLCAAGEYVPASLNGDGYGIGWYSADGVPCVYKSIRPAWNDANLHHLAEKGIRSHLLFAHVRAATAGTSVTEESCHPFAYGRYLFQHNGAIAGWRNGRIRRALLDQLSDELYEYAVRNGASDSIVAFALFLNQMKRGTDVQYSAAALQCMLLRTIALILETTKACLAMVESEASSAAASGSSSTPQDDVFLLNFVVTDGETLLATKYAHGLRNPEAPAASLYFGAASAYEPVASDSSTTAGDYAFAYTAATRSGVVIVASEPLTSNPCDWVSLPRNSILVVTANQHLLMERLPENFSRLSRAVADWNDNHDWTDENSSIMMALRTLSSQDQSDFLMEAKQKSGSALFESSETMIRSRRLENSSRMVGHGLGNSLTESNQCNELIRLGEPDEIIHTGQSQVICMTDLQTGTETGLSMPERGDASERNQHRSMSAASGAAARGKTLLICGNGDGSMSAWDRISGSLWISCPISVEGRGILGLIQWKPNDRSSLRNSDGECDLGILTVSSAADNSLRLHQWTEIGPKLIAEFFCGTETGHPLCLAADQGFIYIGFQDCSVRRLDISKLASERIMLTSAAAIQDFRKYELLRSELLIRMGNQSRDEDQRSDGELDREIKIARQHSGPIHCLAVHSRTHSLFSGSGDGTIGVWNTRDNTRETVLRGHRGAVLALQIDEKADLLFSGSRDRHIRVWDISLNTNYVCRRALMSWEYHRNDICALELSELFFFSGSIDGVIIVWNRTDLVPLAELRFADEAPLSLLRVGRISSASSRTDSLALDSMLYAASTSGRVYGWHVGSSSSLFQNVYGNGPDVLEEMMNNSSNEEPVSIEMNRAGSSKEIMQNPYLLPLRSPRLKLGDFEPSSVAAFERALRTAIRFRSISADANHSNYRDESFRCARWFSHLLESLGADVRMVQSIDGKNPLVLARFADVLVRTRTQSSSANTPQGITFPLNGHNETCHRQNIVFYGHYDVVPAFRDEGWLYEPFDLHVVDGYFYGRGATDNKGPILSMIFAVADLLQQRLQATASGVQHSMSQIISKSDVDQYALTNDLEGTGRPKFEPDSGSPVFDPLVLSTDVVLVLDGEGEAASAGFHEAITTFKEWIAGNDTARQSQDASKSERERTSSGRTNPAETVCILHANSLWVDDMRPCITYGMRGQVVLSVQVTGPARNLHSGFDGGAIVEPAVDLLAILATLTDSKGAPVVPGFFDEVRELIPRERDWYAAIGFDKSIYMKQLGVPRLATDSETDLLHKRWSQPCLSVTDLSTSVDAMQSRKPSEKNGFGRISAVSSLIPRYAQATIAIRTVPNQHPDNLRAAIEHHLHYEFQKRRSPNQLRITCTKQGDWWLGDIDGERFPVRPDQAQFENVRVRQKVFAVAEQAIERVWGVRPLYVREGGSMPLTAWLEEVLEAPAIHLPLGQASDAPHLPNERIRALNLLNGRRVLAEIIRMLAGRDQRFLT